MKKFGENIDFSKVKIRDILEARASDYPLNKPSLFTISQVVERITNATD